MSSFTASSSATMNDPNTTALASVNHDASNSNSNNDNENNRSNQNNAPNAIAKHQGDRYISSVTRLLDRLLSIFEYMRLV